MQWPGATSDYMALVTSGLCYLLENNAVTKLIIDDYAFVRDKAFMKKMRDTLRGGEGYGPVLTLKDLNEPQK